MIIFFIGDLLSSMFYFSSNIGNSGSWYRIRKQRECHLNWSQEIFRAFKFIKIRSKTVMLTSAKQGLQSIYAVYVLAFVFAYWEYCSVLLRLTGPILPFPPPALQVRSPLSLAMLSLLQQPTSPFSQLHSK